jgi:Zn-dependent M32 family carboxypeptidase
VNFAYFSSFLEGITMSQTATAKAVNYTAGQTAELRAAYVASPTDETVKVFAEKLGKSTRSIIAKLTREGVYSKKEYTTKSGGPVTSKETLADAIGKVLQLSEPDAGSLAKANKKALEKIFVALANSVPME